ncbi:MAG: hydantoinase B/oxoprolinase family protein, partial [Acidobacteriota bacterium]
MRQADPIEIRIAAGALASVCEEMGAVLIRSAHSANIKERRDCSAAVFDREGVMVMQAEHIPVHLGSMPASVRAVIDHDHRPEAAVWPTNTEQVSKILALANEHRMPVVTRGAGTALT